MLIECPECTRSVSDRAAACPQCGFPIAEHVQQAAEREQEEHELSSREHAGRTDCPTCEARGFVMLSFKDEQGDAREGFSWCIRCGHSGRIALCRSQRGYWAVTDDQVDAFVAGEIGESEAVTYIGDESPSPRYPDRAAEADGKHGSSS